MVVDETFVRVTDYIPQWYELDRELEAKGVSRKGYQQNFVNNEVDGGAIIDQEVVPVYFEDNAESLQKRVLEREHILLPRVIKLISENKVNIIDGRVKIDK